MYFYLLRFSSLSQAWGWLAITIPKPFICLSDFSRRLQFRSSSIFLRQIFKHLHGRTNGFETPLKFFSSAAECLLEVVVAVFASQPTAESGIEITNKIVDQECLVISRWRRERCKFLLNLGMLLPNAINDLRQPTTIKLSVTGLLIVFGYGDLPLPNEFSELLRQISLERLCSKPILQISQLRFPRLGVFEKFRLLGSRLGVVDALY